MLQLNRKTEYALLSLQHLAQKNDGSSSIVNTREISEANHIPYPLLGKVLHRLATGGLIKSVQGINGGYVMAKAPRDISVLNVVQIFEGKFAMAECMKEEKMSCPQWSACHLKDPLSELNHKIYHLIEQTKISDLLNPPPKEERRTA